MNLTDTQSAQLSEICTWCRDGLRYYNKMLELMISTDGNLTLAGERVVIEKLALAIVPMDEGRRWVWNGKYGHSYETMSDAINAALIDILEAREHE